MTRPVRYLAIAGLAAASLTATACQPAAQEPAETKTETRTIVETREVPGPAVVVERDAPPVVVERDVNRGDSTTVRAGPDGLEVETTNR